MARAEREAASCCFPSIRRFRGGTAILADLKTRYATLDETRVTNGSNDLVLGVHALAGRT
jgi:hypothetical protein